MIKMGKMIILNKYDKTMLYVMLGLEDMIRSGLITREKLWKKNPMEIPDIGRAKKQLKNFKPKHKHVLQVFDALVGFGINEVALEELGAGYKRFLENENLIN